MIKIMTIGEILVDMTQCGKDEKGVLCFAANPGGAPANVSVAASRLGCSTAFVGCVGKDTFGNILRDTLVENKVDVSGLQVTDQTGTTLAVVTVDSKGERTFSFMRSPGADTCIDPEKAVESVKNADILHFGSVSLTDCNCRKTIHGAIREAKKNGAIITYDPNYRASLWSSEEEAVLRMREVLDLCDIIKISDEETVLITGKKEPEEAAEVLLSHGLKIVLITLGAEGAYFRTRSFEGRVPGFKVKVADTNGAGDTFFGAFLSRIAQRGGIDNLTEEEMKGYVRFANKAASITSSRPGAIPAMPTLKEVTEAL